MPTVTPTVAAVNLPNTNTSRTVKNVFEISAQSFSITVNGLNINTDLNLYVDFKKVEPVDIHPAGKLRGEKLTTDQFGRTSFVYYYTDLVPNLGQLPEAQFVNYLNRTATRILVVVCDKASMNLVTLPDDYKDIVRCYSEGFINRSYQVNFDVIREFGIERTTGSQSIVIAN